MADPSKDRYIPHFEPKKDSEPSIALTPLAEEIRKIWESIHQLHGKLDTIELINDLNVTGNISSTDSITATNSITLGNFLQFIQRNFDGDGNLTPDVAPSGDARIYFDLISKKLKVSENLGAYGNLYNPLFGVKVYSTINLPAADSAFTTLAWDSENWDDAGYHNLVTNNSRLTIPTGQGGRYWVWANITFTANAVGSRTFRFLVNGATAIGRVTSPNTAATFNDSLNNVIPYEFAAGDYVECQVNQTSGAPLNIVGTNNVSIFGLTRILIS